jgi:predicted GNAT family acetyltransferase
MSGTNLTLCGKPTTDELEEILMFCNFCGIKSIESQIPGLPMNIDKVLHIMEHTADNAQLNDSIIKNEDMYSFIKFCCGNFHGINFDIVYSNFTRKLNRGITDIYYLQKDEKIISGAITTLYSDDTVYITFVSTASEHRNQGLAAQIIKHIVLWATRMSLRAFTCKKLNKRR